MKKIVFLFLFLPYMCFGMGMKAPKDYPNSVVVSEKENSVLYQVKIHDKYSNYALSYIEFTDIVYETKKILQLNLNVYERSGFFCFEIHKADLPKNFLDPWIYLYNNVTKRYECYQANRQ